MDGYVHETHYSQARNVPSWHSMLNIFKFKIYSRKQLGGTDKKAERAKSHRQYLK